MSFISQFWLQLLEVVRHLGPVEIIDVIVVTFVLYQLLRLLRGTQGTQILVGLVLLAVVGIVSVAFNLILLSWLFRNAIFFIVIAIIVMFQPELRRALDQLGRIGPIGRPLSRATARPWDFRSPQTPSFSWSRRRRATSRSSKKGRSAATSTRTASGDGWPSKSPRRTATVSSGSADEQLDHVDHERVASQAAGVRA